MDILNLILLNTMFMNVGVLYQHLPFPFLFYARLISVSEVDKKYKAIPAGITPIAEKRRFGRRGRGAAAQLFATRTRVLFSFRPSMMAPRPAMFLR